MLPRKKTRTFKGLDRQLLNKLDNALSSVSQMDARKAAKQDPADPLPPDFFFNSQPGVKSAVTTLSNAIAVALALKTA